MRAIISTRGQFLTSPRDRHLPVNQTGHSRWKKRQDMELMNKGTVESTADGVGVVSARSWAGRVTASVPGVSG